MSLLLACVVLTACVPPGFVCTTVGYSTVAQIVLAEPREGVSLELCDGESCEPGQPMMPEEIQPAGTSREPVVDTGIMSIRGDGVTGWSADMLGGHPMLGYRVTDASGVVITEGSVEVEWVRVGGTEQCGGPREARIELPV